MNRKVQVRFGGGRSQKCRKGQLGGRLPNNKLYDTRKVNPVLEAHGEDDYSTLLVHASKAVEHLWRRPEPDVAVQSFAPSSASTNTSAELESTFRHPLLQLHLITGR